MRKAFIEMLIAEGVVPSADAESLRQLLRGAPEPIGSIAFNYGIITGSDIDVVLDEQRRTREKFGEIAVRLGILTREQVGALLEVQQLRAATEVAEALALTGQCSIDDIVAHLGRFLTTQDEEAARAEH